MDEPRTTKLVVGSEVKGMDPDTALKRLLRLDPETSAVGAAVHEINTWLTTGGYLPKAWRSSPVYIAVFRYADGTSEESVHTTKSAAEKKICLYIYEERMRLRDWTEAAQTSFMRALVSGKWFDALEVWRAQSPDKRWAEFTIAESVIEGEEDISFNPREEALRPRPKPRK